MQEELKKCPCVLLASNPGLWSGGSVCHRAVLSCQQAEQTGPSGAGAGKGFCKSKIRLELLVRCFPQSYPEIMRIFSVVNVEKTYDNNMCHFVSLFIIMCHFS